MAKIKKWRKRKYDRVTFQKDNNELDEIVLSNIDSIHIERMDTNHFWMSIYVEGKTDNTMVINFVAKGNKLIAQIAENGILPQTK